MAARPRRRIRPAVRALVVLAVVGGVLAAVLSSEAPPDPAEVQAFTTGLVPIVQDWGAVEILGMRPAVADLRDGTGVPPITIVTEAQAWQAAFDGYERDLEALGTPRGLEDVVAQLRLSLSRYRDAAAAFEAAAAAAAEGQAFDLDVGIDAASEGAETFDDAVATLNLVRRAVGLDPEPSLAGSATSQGGE